MTTTFNPQQLQTELGLDVGDDDGPELATFASVSDTTRNALTAFFEHSARRLVERAKMPPDGYIVRDTKVFVNCVTKIERINRWQGHPARDGSAHGLEAHATPEENYFVRITKRTRRFLSTLLELVTVLVAKRARDITDEHVMRDGQIMVDCVVKVERLNQPPKQRPRRVDKDSDVERESRDLAQLAQAITTIDRQYTEHLRRQAKGTAVPAKPAEATPQPVKDEHQGQDARATIPWRGPDVVRSSREGPMPELPHPRTDVPQGKLHRHGKNRRAKKPGNADSTRDSS